MSSLKTAYGTATSGDGTGLVASLATSATWVAGVEWFVVDNTTELALTWELQGVIRVGTTPTVSTEIRLYLVASYDGTTWPDVFDGTPSAETVTSEGVRDGFARLAAVLRVDSTTSNRDYPFFIDVASFYGGAMPKKVAVFVAHNSAAALNSTGGSHTWAAQPVYLTSA